MDEWRTAVADMDEWDWAPYDHPQECDLFWADGSRNA